MHAQYSLQNACHDSSQNRFRQLHRWLICQCLPAAIVHTTFPWLDVFAAYAFIRIMSQQRWTWRRCRKLLKGSHAPVHDGGPGRAGDTIVVGLAQAADGTDAGLGQEVHGQVGQAFLCNDHIRPVVGDLFAHLPDVVLLQLQQFAPGQQIAYHQTAA